MKKSYVTKRQKRQKCRERASMLFLLFLALSMKDFLDRDEVRRQILALLVQWFSEAPEHQYYRSF